jgi:AraC-like DNA-binding protein
MTRYTPSGCGTLRITLDARAEVKVKDMADRLHMSPTALSRLLMAFALSRPEELSKWLSGQ